MSSRRTNRSPGSILQEEHRDHSDHPGETRGGQADPGTFSSGAFSTGGVSSGTSGLGRGPGVPSRALWDL
jgi:hypothetical protein